MQTKTDSPKNITQIRFPHPYPFTNEGVSQALLDEYSAIVQKYEEQWSNIPPKQRKLEQADKDRLKAIYRQMSLKQQANQVIGFHYGYPPTPAIKPTRAQLDAFKNDHVYGVWVDDKKITNSELDKYKPGDFGDVLISSLTKYAYNHKRYRYEVDLLTVKCSIALQKEMEADEFKDHMWTRAGVTGFKIKDDKYAPKQKI